MSKHKQGETSKLESPPASPPDAAAIVEAAPAESPEVPSVDTATADIALDALPELSKVKLNKNATLIRAWLVNRLLALRSYSSQLPDNVAVVDRLRGKEGEQRVARIVAFVLMELGYEIETPVADSANIVRRAVAGLFRQGG